MRLFSVLMVGFMLVVGAMPILANTVSTADQAAIRQVIQSQLNAFQDDDAERAFSYASPSIQARFGSADRFLRMVKIGYEPVYRPGSVFFQDLIANDAVVVQTVLITDQQGRSLLASYPMEQQDNGSWRIAGCTLRPVTDNLL